MPARRPRSDSGSPDPLATPLEECITISTTPSRPHPSTTAKRRAMPKSGPSTPTPTPRKAAATDVPLTSGRKRRVDAAVAQDLSIGVESARKRRTPLAKQSPLPNELVGEPGGAQVSQDADEKVRSKGREKGKQKESAESPARSVNKQNMAPPAATPVLSGRRSTLGSAIKALPTPSPAGGRGRAAALVLDPATPPVQMRNFDEAFAEDDTFGTLSATPARLPKAAAASGSGGAISRDTFLANESLRRQREARNFKYEGDENAPKLTRSGRIVGSRKQREDEDVAVDEYGAQNDPSAEDGAFGEGVAIPVPGSQVQIDRSPPVIPPIAQKAQSLDSPAKAKANSALPPLSPAARTHVLQILSTLTGQSVASYPAPFADEETNEALQGLVNLLRGTVERGEGNSALVVGPRGSGKTRTMARALQLLPSTSKTAPIVVYLSGHAQTNDKLAIREMGRQIAEAEGRKPPDEAADEEEEGENQEEYAPTTLPSHLLALLTVPSPRAIIIVMEEFDLFTEHARQALLYCLLDVVQSVKTGPVESTGRGVAVIGLTSRIDTLLLLEKRVKSRFSHRVWRVTSPLSPGGPGWKGLLRAALLPWDRNEGEGNGESSMTGGRHLAIEVDEEDGDEEELWQRSWGWAIDSLLADEKVIRYLDRLTGLTTDVRNLYRPFILPVAQIAADHQAFISVPVLTASIIDQIENAGWGLANNKLKGLSQPALAVLVISKHLHYAGREEFNFAQVEEEYLRFGRTRLVGSGRSRWPIGVLRLAYDHLLHLGLLVPVGSTSLKPHYAKARCTLSPHEIVAWFKGEGANALGTELGNWGRTMGGHA